MKRYRLTWTETLTATVEAESEDHARAIWTCDGIEGYPADNRHDYELKIERESV